VRGQHLERWPTAREVDEVDVDGLPIRVKVSPGRVKAEFDDAARASARSGRPVREVLSAAEEAWRTRTGGHHHDHDEEGPSDPAS
jgi:uncharacterized protein (DUF111 family)